MERAFRRELGWPGTSSAKWIPATRRGGAWLSRLRWAAVVCSVAVATCGQKGPLELPPERAFAERAEHGLAMREFAPRLEAS